MNGPTPVARLPEALAAPVARLALRQQNLQSLLPVLLHDVNGSLNGLTLSTELLARLLPATREPPADTAASAANLLQRTRSELGRLKTVLRAMELRLAPGGGPGTTPSPRTPFDAALQDVQSVLMPAVRRNQLEWHLAAPAGESVVVALRPEDSFDLLAALAIIAIEGAPARSVLELTTIREGDRVLLAIGHAGSPQASFALELHRELLRVAATHAGGSVDWQQSARGAVARLALPCAIG
jgi:hypothetical protein